MGAKNIIKIKVIFLLFMVLLDMLAQLEHITLAVVDWFIRIFFMAVAWLYNLLMSLMSRL